MLIIYNINYIIINGTSFIYYYIISNNEKI
uniref:Uncharacterized protein n=1 Tax=viral metagenome TaxID=1070528 RepID=A0A6C0H878_9ZZZZ